MKLNARDKSYTVLSVTGSSVINPRFIELPGIFSLPGFFVTLFHLRVKETQEVVK